jgi:hypothetical protein
MTSAAMWSPESVKPKPAAPLGQYVPAADASGDAVADVRRGWDQQVRYGLNHPALYALLYGRVAPGGPAG